MPAVDDAAQRLPTGVAVYLVGKDGQLAGAAWVFVAHEEVTSRLLVVGGIIGVVARHLSDVHLSHGGHVLPLSTVRWQVYNSGQPHV